MLTILLLLYRYDMPLVLFVGINHHGQSVIFACALLSQEGADEYKWALSKFLECMGDVKPKAIMTDQCLSIEIAVRDIFGDETVHRNCSWHILHKLTEHWGNVKGKKDRTTRIKDIVYNSLSIDEFESRWKEAMSDYNKTGDPWFEKIFNDVQT